MVKAVIVSAQRCGGLFLAGCLSSHRDIHCPREEPFRRESPWQQKLAPALAKAYRRPHAVLLDFVLDEPHYQVAACRLTYDQAFHEELQQYIKQAGVRILHLVREDLAVVTSTLLAKQEIARGVPRHWFVDAPFVDNEILDVAPAEVLHRIQHLRKQRARFAELYHESKQILIDYDAMVPPPDRGGTLQLEERDRICKFLGVVPLPMYAHNRKMHRRPIASYYSRWADIEAALK